MEWQESKEYLIGTLKHLKCPKNIRIAGFDLDDTIIKYKPRAAKFEVKYNNVIEKITEYIKKDYFIVIFSNQSNLSKPHNLGQWKSKYINFIDSIKKEFPKHLYIAIYVSLQNDIYRKPNLGLWNLMKDNLKAQFNNENLKISKKSFFVGDAAGRYKTSEHPKDFSDSDRKFALNIGIDFYTPEEFFLNGKKEKYQLVKFTIPDNIPEIKKFKSHKPEIILMCGAPGSGKTIYCLRYIVPKKYIYINNDTGKIVSIKNLKQMMKNNQSIVIDNTNMSVESRKKYINIAKEKNYFIRVIYMNTSIELAKHLNNVRHIVSDGTIPKIPTIVYRVFNRYFVKPTLQEGFDVIEELDFHYDSNFLEDKNWVKKFNIMSES